MQTRGQDSRVVHLRVLRIAAQTSRSPTATALRRMRLMPKVK
jgi:hypothetical protein